MNINLGGEDVLLDNGGAGFLLELRSPDLTGDGTVNLVGELVEFADNNYILSTGFGDMKISADRVSCEGDACPDFSITSADVQVANSDDLYIEVPQLIQEITLKSAGGNVMLVGEFIELIDNTYVVRTSFGDMKVSAEHVSCEGDACPDQAIASGDAQIAH